MKRLRVVSILVATLLMGGCDLFGPSGPGTWDAVVTGPSPVGAVVVELTGPGIEGLDSQGGASAFGAVVSAQQGRARVVVVAGPGQELRFGIRVTELGDGPPVATVIEAATMASMPTSAPGLTVKITEGR